MLNMNNTNEHGNGLAQPATAMSPINAPPTTVLESLIPDIATIPDIVPMAGCNEEFDDGYDADDEGSDDEYDDDDGCNSDEDELIDDEDSEGESVVASCVGHVDIDDEFVEIDLGDEDTSDEEEEDVDVDVDGVGVRLW